APEARLLELLGERGGDAGSGGDVQFFFRGGRGRLAHRRLQHAGEGVGHLVLDVALALDVDAAADQLGGQAHVLAALADGQRELLVFHDDVEVRHLGLLRYRYAGDLGRRQRALREGHQVVAVLDDVDLLAAQLADDRLHARALHADAGADRIDVALAAVDRHLGALAGSAHGVLDHHRAVVDLRHLGFEELDEQTWIGAREHDLRPLRLLVHLDDDGADALALAVALVAGLLRTGNHRLRAPQVDDDVAALEALDGAVEHLAD